MKLAFCLFHYFPYGGLQRDCLRIAQACQTRGHEVHLFTTKWEGEKPCDMTIEILKPKGFSNHRRMFHFSELIRQRLQQEIFDCVIGFNKMDNLDIYYAADGCFAAKSQYRFNLMHRLFSRYQTYKSLEKAVFQRESTTAILCISPTETAKYQKHYQTPEKRLHRLPPGIRRDCLPPDNILDIRRTARQQLEVSENDWLLLTIASHFHTKGVDRAIDALRALPEEKRAHCKLFIVGPDRPEPYQKLLTDDLHVTFLGPRDDVPNLLFSADLMLHFARVDNTGTVILEAIVAGLPVLCTSQCGYASYVKLANAGLVLSEKFTPHEASSLLESALKKNVLTAWHQHALAYGANHDLFSMVDRAVEFIESFK